MGRRNGGTPSWGPFDRLSADLAGFGGRRQRPPSRASIAITAVVAAVFLLPLLVGPLITFLTDLLWFRSLGYEDVFLTRYTAAGQAFIGFTLLFLALAVPNLYAVLRPRVGTVVEARPARAPALSRTLRLLPLLLLPAFLFGLAAASRWDDILRWRHAAAFGRTDPEFGQDIGFYFFTLPVLDFVRGWLFTALLLITVGAIAAYVLRGLAGVVTGASRGRPTEIAVSLARPVRAHLSILGGLVLLLLAAGHVLDRYDLLFRDEGVITGAGYTSVNARLLALTLMAGIAALAAIACFANVVARTLWVLAGAVALWVATALLVGGVYPAIVDTLVVRPDQLGRERPYIERSIAATRAAYGLDRAEESQVSIAASPTPDEIRAELADPESLRLWDHRPLLAGLRQIQALRPYYQFNDVDIDRYRIGGRERLVMLSARELDITRLPREARTWQNDHLFYTHGFGAVMTTAGGVTAEGMPRLVLRDVPPQGEPRIEQPRIYYGELTRDYVIVGTTLDEFDHAGERDVTTRFTGGGGVRLGSLWDRLLFALRFGDFNLLISGQVTSESRVLFNRQIAERARLVAPFLRFDRDPYLVIADGRLFWVHDAYTVGQNYPYSRRSGRPAINYIRNSVKVVTDAHDGSMTFYVSDPEDPVVRTLRAIYPSLLGRTVAEMPPSLRAHLRYPEDLFQIQVEMLSNYHMTNPDEFYNRGDAWRIAFETFHQGGGKQPIEPYYVLARLPGSREREFVLMVPMTPAGADRDNMVAWVAGRVDGENFGRLRLLRFPKDRLIFGPLQIEARIESDAAIRQQLALLSAGGGAQVIRGNLITMPVGESFLYFEPLFVQATQGGIPELKRVILATQDRVVMDDTFERAIARLIDPTTPPVAAPPGMPPPPTPPPGARPGPSPTPAAGDIPGLVRQASDVYARAQEALRAGDLERYGREIRALDDILARLRAATGQR